MSILQKISRPLLAAPFVSSGLDALMRPAEHRERTHILLDLARETGCPVADTDVTPTTVDMATRVTGAVIALSGLALASGRLPRSAALLLGTLHIPLALANNPFWLHEGDQRKRDLAGLIQNAGLIGGALMAARDRSGAPSLGWHAHRLADEISQSASAKFDALGAQVSA
ncbi:DoxX family protein [Arcanobacterium canis]